MKRRAWPSPSQRHDRARKQADAFACDGLTKPGVHVRVSLAWKAGYRAAMRDAAVADKLR